MSLNFSIGVPACLRVVRNGKQLWCKELKAGTHDIDIDPGERKATFEYYLKLEGAHDESVFGRQVYSTLDIGKYWIARARALADDQRGDKAAWLVKATRVLKRCLPQSARLLGEAYALLAAANRQAVEQGESSADSQPDAEHACQMLTPAERHRNAAFMLARQAHEESEAGRVKLALALTKAAQALIEAAGDKRCHAALLLLHAKTSLASKLGQHDRACRFALKALRLSKALFGKTHPETLLCLANIGEVLIAAGQARQARPHIETAIGFFQHAQATGRWSVEYMRTSMVKALEQLLQSTAST